MDPLSMRDQMILDAGRLWWKYFGAKEAKVRSTFDLSLARYHQVLMTLLDGPEALAYAPDVVRRLQRLRDARQHQRSRARLAS